MSTLKADTIVASDGSSPVTLTKQSAAKAWQESVTSSTQTVNDSLNVSSISDNGGGLSTLAWTNSFASTNYTYPMTRSGSNNTSNTFQMEMYNKATGSLSFSTKFSDTSSINMGDSGSASSSHHGDLA